MIKPTKAQQRALAKLTNEWQSAYQLKETIPTLEGLFRRGLAEQLLDKGYLMMPHNQIKFRLKPSEEKKS